MTLSWEFLPQRSKNLDILRCPEKIVLVGAICDQDMPRLEDHLDGIHTKLPEVVVGGTEYTRREVRWPRWGDIDFGGVWMEMERENS